MYDATTLKKNMESVAKLQSSDAQTLFAPLMVARSILTAETTKKEYDDWVDSLTTLVQHTDKKAHQIIYRVLAVIHFKYEHEMKKVGKYSPLNLLLKVGLEKGAYYYHFEHPDMRRQVFADFGVSDVEAFALIRKKMKVLESIMDKGETDRDRVAASKELTKYVDHLIIPSKKSNFFANNMMMDNSKDKTIHNTQVDFSKLPSMEDVNVRKELAGHRTTVTEDGEVIDDE